MHRCLASVPLHLVIEMWAMAIEEFSEDLISPTNQSNLIEGTEQVLALSLQAVKGSEGKKIIRLWGNVHFQKVLILLDSGSSSSFIGCHLLGAMPTVQKLTRPVSVKVADGGLLWSKFIIPSCSFFCQGRPFFTNLKVPPLSGYDIIHGMDWLETFSSMTVHWTHKWLEFEYKGKMIKVQGFLPRTNECQMLTRDQLEALIW